MNHLLCKQCEATYGLDDPRWKCDCGSVLDIEFKPVFDLNKIAARKQTMWRYREAIPIQSDSNIVSFDEGFTPVAEVDFNGRSVLIKQDHLFPAGSFKDRGASVVVSKAQELGIEEVVEDSSGNAACAVAAYCAKAQIDCHIFVPESTSAGKLAQMHLYGARVNKIPGSREETARAVIDAAQEIYYASHSWNPFFFQGTKTFAYEVCEQLGWKAPDTVIVPVGNGTLLLGVQIGFNELLDAGIIDKRPRIVAIQSANCAPLYRAFKENLNGIPVLQTSETIAEGIAVNTPIR